VNQKRIEKARRSLHHAGTLDDRNSLRSAFIATLTDDIETLRQSKASVEADFKRTLERWRTERVPDTVPVRAIPSDVTESRLYRVTALFALLCEMGLAAWIFSRLGVPWIFGVASAICITFTLHGVFLHVFDNPERPKETLHRLKCFASAPAVVGFMTALALAVLARYVSGNMAVALLPLFSLALWLGTISLLMLAASLFTLAHIRGWSLRYEKQYRALDSEERASVAFLKELNRESAIVPASDAHEPEVVSPRPDGKAAAAHGAAFSALAVLALALTANTGCSPAATSADNPPAPIAAEAPAGLHIYIDWSGSPVRPALEEAWNTIKDEIPRIAEDERIGTLTVSRFDEDGWCPPLLAQIPLPMMREPARMTLASSEWETFANIRAAVRDSETASWEHERDAVHARYDSALRAALKELDAAHALPPPDFETRQSDPVGLLERIAQTREPHPEFAIALTDMADTRHVRVPPIPPPEGATHLLVLLTPAKPKDAVMTLGSAMAGPEQFALRVRQLHESVPWAVVAPYFQHNLAALFKPARKNN